MRKNVSKVLHPHTHTQINKIFPCSKKNSPGRDFLFLCEDECKKFRQKITNKTFSFIMSILAKACTKRGLKKTQF